MFEKSHTKYTYHTMFNLVWRENGQDPRSLFTTDTELCRGDIIRMLEPTFAKFGPQPIISNNPDASIKDAHFRICWINVPSEMLAEGASIQHACDVHRVEESGWLTRGKTTYLGNAYVEQMAAPSNISLQASTLGAVSPQVINEAALQGIHEKLDSLCTKIDALTAALYDKILTDEAAASPVPTAATLQSVLCDVKPKPRLHNNASLYEQIINFDKANLRSASSAAKAEERIWLQRESILFRTPRTPRKKIAEEEIVTLPLPPRRLRDLY